MTRRALSGVSARRQSARGPQFQVVAVPEIARGVSIPPPVQGWDAVTPIAAMPETRAVTLDNLFPQPGYLEIRRGHKTHQNLGGVTSAPVESLMPYHGLTTAADALFAAAGARVFNVIAGATTTVSAALSGLSNARWQHVNFSTSGGNFLWMCNGADIPRLYDGAVWATASITGITPASVVNVTVFKERIWMVRNDLISPAYLNVDSVQGTATVFDLAGVFKNGGFLMSVGAWSREAGDGPDDFIAFITSRGEVAVYQGTDPASNFTIKGVYEMGSPIGRRCLTKVGGDLAVVSIDGVLPLSRALVTDRAAILNESLTKLIQPVMNDSARQYKGNFGWQLIGYPRGTRAILNVPITENVSQHQYVMNTVTGAWCRFKGEDANCWAVFQDRLFYGANNGRVFEADAQGFDENGTITIDVETAFNYCGARGRLKQFTMARALLTTDGQVSPGMSVNVDFQRQSDVTIITFPIDPTALWDVALWDQGVWPEIERIITDWVTVSGEGYAASMRMSANVQAESTAAESQALILRLNGWDMQVIDGAFV